MRNCIFAAVACTALSLAGAAHADALKRAGFLGVNIAPHPKGIAIVNLVEAGTAKSAGLLDGDVITAFNGERVTNPGPFVAAVGKLREGDEVEIEFLRGGNPGMARATIRPRPYESAPGVETRYLSLEVNGVRRRLIVTVPRATGRHPAILYLTGIGCFAQESLGIQSAEAKLLYGLTAAGFVTMRVEKSGIGDSEGPPCNADEYDFSAEVSGYIAGLLALRGYDFVDPGKVFVLGLSIGGVEAPIVARQAPVKGVVVINTVARPFLEYLQQLRRRQMALNGAPFDEIEDRLALSERCNRALLVEGKAPEAIVAGDPACREHIGFPAPTAFMREWAQIVPAKEWKPLDAPVLVVTGDMDYVALPADAPYLRDMIDSFHPGRATLATVPGMTHALGHADSLKDALAKGAGAPFEPRVIDTVRDWLERAARG